jgi:hypothetical protein
MNDENGNTNRGKEAAARATENARQTRARLEKENPGWFGVWLNASRSFNHGLRLPTREQAHVHAKELTFRTQLRN